MDKNKLMTLLEKIKLYSKNSQYDDLIAAITCIFGIKKIEMIFSNSSKKGPILCSFSSTSEVRNFFNDIDKNKYPSSLNYDIYKYLKLIKGINKVNKISEVILNELILWLKDFDAMEGKDLHKGYEAILSDCKEWFKYGNQHSTDNSIIEFVLNTIDVHKISSIYDPCCGYGEFLTRFCLKVQKYGYYDLFKDRKKSSISGCEVDQLAHLIATTRLLLLCEKYDDDLKCVNSFEDELVSTKEYNFIFVEPPIGEMKPVPNNNTYNYKIPIEYNFIVHTLNKLSTDGIAYIVLPKKFLISDSAQSIRKRIVDLYSINAVIELPESKYHPQYSSAPCLLVVQKSPQVSNVWFQKFEDLELISLNNYTKESNIYNNRSLTDKSFYVDIKKIINSGYDLSIAKYSKNSIDELFDWLKANSINYEEVSLSNIAIIKKGFALLQTKKRNGIIGEFTEFPIINAKNITYNFNLEGDAYYCVEKDINRYKNYLTEPSDILLSIKGTLGKLAIVPNNFKPAVVSNTLTRIKVINPKVKPEYLLRLLDSPFYQEWFALFSNTEIVKHLPIESIRSLRIPILDENYQDRIIKNYLPGSSRESIYQLLMNKNQGVDRYTELFYAYISKYANDNRFYDKKKYDDFIKELYAVLNVSYSNNDLIAIKNDLVNKKCKDSKELILLLLDTVSKYIQSNSEASKLYFLTEYDENIKEYLYKNINRNDYRTGDISKFWNNFYTMERNKLLSKMTISVELSPGALYPNSDLQLIIRNNGAFHLANVKIKNDISEEVSLIDILEAKQSTKTSVNIGNKTAGRYIINVLVKGTKIDDTYYESKYELAFEVKDYENNRKVDEVIINPYNIGNPIDQPEMFYGRKKIINKILSKINNPNNSSVVILEGTRRIGKTSIIYYLLNKEVDRSKWIPVFCDFQNAKGSKRGEGIETAQLFQFIAQKISDEIIRITGKIEIPGYEPLIKNKIRFIELTRNKYLEEYLYSDDAFNRFEILLNYWLEDFPGRRLLLMLDEFDKIQIGIDNKITDLHVLENLRSLFQHNKRLCVLISGSNRLKEMRNEQWSTLYGLGMPIRVSFFESDEVSEARNMIIKPVENVLTFSDEAVDHIIGICALQPYFIQYLCGAIFDMCIYEKKVYSINKIIVDEAINKITKENEHFYSLWRNTINSDRKRYLIYSIKECEEAGLLVNDTVLSERIGSDGVNYIKENEYYEELEELKNLDIIKTYEKGGMICYSFAVPLFKVWIKQNISKDECKKKAIIEGEGKF